MTLGLARGPAQRPGREQAQPAGVVVLGVHRSGTSAVNGMFASAGFYVCEPGEAFEGNQFNPRGFAEHPRVLELNDWLLTAIGSNWFDAPPPSAFEPVEHEARGLIAGLVASLRDAAGDAPLALKDPRIGVMWPVWGPVVGDLLHPVLVIRDPVEVARSLAVRDELPTPISLASWETQMTTMLEHLHGRTVTVVNYQRLLEHPAGGRELVAAVTGRLSPRYAPSIDAAAADAGLEPDLRRHRADPADHDTYLTMFQRDLWSFLEALEMGAGPLEVPPSLTRASEASRQATRAECLRMLRSASDAWRHRQSEAATRRLMRIVGGLTPGGEKPA